MRRDSLLLSKPHAGDAEKGRLAQRIPHVRKSQVSVSRSKGPQVVIPLAKNKCSCGGGGERFKGQLDVPILAMSFSSVPKSGSTHEQPPHRGRPAIKASGLRGGSSWSLRASGNGSNMRTQNGTLVQGAKD